METKTGDDTLKSQDLETSLDISNLLYLEKKESNVIVERTQKIQYADSPSYDSDSGVIVVNWQTGSDYISSKDSYLRVLINFFDAAGVRAVAGDTWNFGDYGSVLNCFKTVRVVSRAGDVIAQTDAANLLNYYKVQYEHSAAWKAQQGLALIGVSQPLKDGDLVDTEFLIPLQLISSFFESNELLPNMLCRGMRLEITLQSAPVALVNLATELITSYTLSGVQLHLDSYSLTSGAVNWLNDRSASEGLVMTYHDYENSHFDKAAGQASYAFESRKTASMANSVMTTIRAVRGTEIKEDSFASVPLAATSNFQYRVASLFLPIQPVSGKLQAYQQQNYALDRLHTGKELGVSLAQFDKLAVNSAILDRYWLEGSGLAINNSTTLTISGNHVDAAADDVDIFLKHTRSLVIFLQNIRRSQ